MKSASDHYTSDIFGNRPGRPLKLNPKTAVQRSREYCVRKKLQAISVTRHTNYCVDGVGQLGRVA